MNPPPSRYHGLDAIRASMMLLGILLHLAIPYTGVIIPGYFVNDRIVPALQLMLIVHYFRMPAFFLLAGFFSGLLWESRGGRYFLRNRWKKIGLVWVAALVVELPFVSLVGVYNHFARLPGNTFALTWAAVSTRAVDPLWLPKAPIHLWFLEYLILFCTGAAVLRSAAAQSMPVLDLWMGSMIRSRFRAAAFCIPTAMALWNMPLARVPYPDSFVPWLGVSAVYGWFYTVGWSLYRRRDLLDLLARNIQAEKLAAPVLLAVVLELDKRRLSLGLANAFMLDAAIAILTALFMWSLIFALIGVFHAARNFKWLPYVSDASYWIYIAHYPFVLLMPALLRDWQVSPLLKVLLSSILIFGLLLVGYQRFVRYTWLGRALNGVRGPVEKTQRAIAVS